MRVFIQISKSLSLPHTVTFTLTFTPTLCPLPSAHHLLHAQRALAIGTGVFGVFEGGNQKRNPTAQEGEQKEDRRQTDD